MTASNKTTEFYGLTQERYQQMMQRYGNENLVKEVVDDWGPDLCNQGWDIFVQGSHMIEIQAIDAVGAYEDDEAVALAIQAGVKIIPVDELPENFDRRYLGWIDTEENRKAIAKYCESHLKNMPKECDTHGKIKG